MHKKCKVIQRGVWRLVKNVKPAAGGENNASRSGGGGRQKWDEKRTDCKCHSPLPKGVQDVIPVKAIYDDGIFQVGRDKFTRSFKFTDINYAVASREDKEAMFLEYSELLNSLDSGATTKITINNRRLNRLDFEKTILILNRITQNRAKGKNTFIFIDEIYLLFQHEYSANFLFTLWKRVRKYGAYASGITQNVDDLLQSHTARTMLANSEFIIMLNQASTDRIELAKLLNISDTQLSYMVSITATCGSR